VTGDGRGAHPPSSGARRCPRPPARPPAQSAGLAPSPAVKFQVSAPESYGGAAGVVPAPAVQVIVLALAAADVNSEVARATPSQLPSGVSVWATSVHCGRGGEGRGAGPGTRSPGGGGQGCALAGGGAGGASGNGPRRPPRRAQAARGDEGMRCPGPSRGHHSQWGPGRGPARRGRRGRAPAGSRQRRRRRCGGEPWGRLGAQGLRWGRRGRDGAMIGARVCVDGRRAFGRGASTARQARGRAGAHSP
jgi:hypothetical protein